MILILTGVSGVGKTTIANYFEKNKKYKKSISYTTRKPRFDEVNGHHYNFISKEEFEVKIKECFFLEHTNQFDNYYGTSFEDIEKLKKNNNIIMCLSYDGYLSSQKKWPNETVGIYLLPPSYDELSQRLSLRKNNETNKRLEGIYEQSNYESQYFSNLIKPDTIENTIKNIEEILTKHKKTTF